LRKDAAEQAGLSKRQAVTAGTSLDKGVELSALARELRRRP
jgi:hypothetical protein